MGGGLARKWDGFSGGAVGSLIVGGWLGVGGDGSVLGVGVPVSGVGRGMGVELAAGKGIIGQGSLGLELGRGPRKLLEQLRGLVGVVVS